MPQNQLRDNDLIAQDFIDLATDPRVTDDVIARLGPRAQHQVRLLRSAGVVPPSPPPEPQSLLERGVQHGADVSIGALKGAGQTGLNVARAARRVPGIGAGLDALSRAQGVDPEQTYGAAGRAELDPTNTAQRIGKNTEQIGEYLAGGSGLARPIAAGVTAARRAGLRGAVNLLPEGASRGATIVSQLNRLLTSATPALSGAGASGAVAAAHGSENPLPAAAFGGAGAAAGQGLGAMTQTDLGRRILPFLLGGGAYAGAKGLGLPDAYAGGGGLMLGGAFREAIRHAMQSNPSFVAVLRAILEGTGRTAGAAGSELVE
jgi:hypothetical protein